MQTCVTFFVRGAIQARHCFFKGFRLHMSGFGVSPEIKHLMPNPVFVIVT
jgi:hypothetical protein